MKLLHRSLVRKINASLPEAKVEVIYTQESENTAKQMTVQGESNSYSIIVKCKRNEWVLSKINCKI